MSSTRVRIVFAGLMVFRPNKGTFELGVLRALNLRGGMPDHVLQINIFPDSSSGEKPSAISPASLESYVKAGDVAWSIEVRNLPGSPNLHTNTGIPSDRHQAAQPNQNDFGWMINLESGEFHAKTLTRSSGVLKPVISLDHGVLETVCKTEIIDVQKGGKPFRDDFGFITGAAALTIDTTGNEQVTLKTQGQADLFNLKPGVSYDIALLNTPLSAVGLPTGGHFGLYYDLLFPSVPSSERFAIKSHHPIKLPSDGCLSKFRPEMVDPNPFKCGGIVVNETGGPLQ